MSSFYSAPKYPSSKQVEIWSLKRENYLGKDIAEKKSVSPARVSQLLKEANERIGNLLETTAKANKIQLEVISAQLGYAQGVSCIFNVQAYITFSPANGLQVWYDHKGHCGDCEEFADCRRIILQEFRERKIRVPNEFLQPTDLGELLFRTVEEMLK
jgi:hypothetical protein